MDRAARYKIGVFLSTPLIDAYIDEYKATSNQIIFTTSLSFRDAVEQANEWKRQGVEVFISRRGTGAVLRQNISAPVLLLPLSEMEIVSCLRNACTKGMRVLIPMHRALYSGLEQLAELVGVTIIQKIYNNLEELDAIVRHGLDTGAEVVAGGGTTLRLAEKYGIPAIDLSPSKEHFFTILDSACNVAASNRERDVMVKEMEWAMNAMYDGVISLDQSGIVLSANDAALKLFKCRKKEELCGTPITKYWGNSLFQAMRNGDWEQQANIIDIAGTPLVASVSLISNMDSVERILVTLRKTHDIIRQSNTIRSNILRGFKAYYNLNDVIYKSNDMHEILQLCKAYAALESTVFIQGATGTGKEMLAQGIHNLSGRANKPFVSVNCAELPEHLLESELFGHEEGAFTGSRKGGKAGLFELAQHGTILLDEIDSASNSVQSKLLRVLQEKEIMRVGGHCKVPVDVRILATSGRDLWELVKIGQFRNDLFFRLNIMTIHVPLLCERPADIDVLLPYFMRVFAKAENIASPVVGPHEMALLRQYPWPGNVRQLRTFAERFVVYSSFMSDPFDKLYQELQMIAYDTPGAHSTHDRHGTHGTHGSHDRRNASRKPPLNDGQASRKSPLGVEEAPHQHGAPPFPRPASFSANLPPQKRTDGDERAEDILQYILNNRREALNDPELLEQVLQYTCYSKKDAARILGVSRSTLWRKLNQTDC